MSISIDTVAALEYFKITDPVMYRLTSQALAAPTPLRIPTPRPPEAYFESIVDAIIGQQISTKAAASIRGRVHDVLKYDVTPERVLATEKRKLRAAGLSERKVEYIVENARGWQSVAANEFTTLPDEVIIDQLVSLRGIGRWTAEMFLLFSMARPNIFSYGDLGLMQGLYQLYGYYPHYTRKIRDTVDSWSPHRSVASLTLWHQRDNRPQ